MSSPDTNQLSSMELLIRASPVYLNFADPAKFATFVDQTPDLKITREVRQELVPKLPNYALQFNLDLLFQVGFTKEELCESELFNSIVWAGSELLQDWITKDVGASTREEDFCDVPLLEGLLECVPNSYYRRVVCYLMKCRSDLISYKYIMKSKILIREFVKCGFMTRADWIKQAKRLSPVFSSTILSALTQ